MLDLTVIDLGSESVGELIGSKLEGNPDVPISVPIFVLVILS